MYTHSWNKIMYILATTGSCEYQPAHRARVREGARPKPTRVASRALHGGEPRRRRAAAAPLGVLLAFARAAFARTAGTVRGGPSRSNCGERRVGERRARRGQVRPRPYPRLCVRTAASPRRTAGVGADLHNVISWFTSRMEEAGPTRLARVERRACAAVSSHVRHRWRRRQPIPAAYPVSAASRSLTLGPV
jgi:hypothetical protein